jgi:hypothetical protein
MSEMIDCIYNGLTCYICWQWMPDVQEDPEKLCGTPPGDIRICDRCLEDLGKSVDLPDTLQAGR